MASFSVLQVLAVRWVDPPVTPITLLRRVEAGLEGRWLKVERLAAPAEGYSPQLVRAVLTAEDDRFFVHRGFDWKNIRRAVGDHLDEGRELRGASTLTQQCARTLFLWPQRSWVRKGMEAWYAAWMELLLSKERILHLYLGYVEWGPGVFGAEAASRRTFHKGAGNLAEDQAALLAAVLPAPRTWSAEHPSPRVRRRQAMIEARMHRSGSLDQMRAAARAARRANPEPRGSAARPPATAEPAKTNAQVEPGEPAPAPPQEGVLHGPPVGPPVSAPTDRGLDGGPAVDPAPEPAPSPKAPGGAGT